MVLGFVLFCEPEVQAHMKLENVLYIAMEIYIAGITCCASYMPLWCGGYHAQLLIRGFEFESWLGQLAAAHPVVHLPFELVD